MLRRMVLDFPFLCQCIARDTVLTFGTGAREKEKVSRTARYEEVMEWRVGRGLVPMSWAFL